MSSVGDGGSLSHDDQVDGLNHKLGLLVASFLAMTEDTGGLGNGSSLGSESEHGSVSALHVLLVSGMLSEFGSM